VGGAQEDAKVQVDKKRGTATVKEQGLHLKEGQRYELFSLKKGKKQRRESRFETVVHPEGAAPDTLQDPGKTQWGTR